MLFNSLHFVFFLPIVLGLYFALPAKYRWLLLLGASYYFYLAYDWRYGFLLLATTGIDFYAAKKIGEADKLITKKKWLWLSLISNIGCLFAFKYFVFFYNSFYSLVNNNPSSLMESWIVPVGLSFYTFQSLAYVMDVYRGKVVVEKNLGHFALFVSFFPQLVAGPIERYNNLMPQLFEKVKLTAPVILSAAKIMVWGFFKKLVIADRLAEFVNPVFESPETYNGLTLLITAFFFVVQVYCDFSGYTDIATGVARLFGVELMLNWRSPLLAHSLHDFWQRNHISLTTWFRDYLYIPLGGSRKGNSRKLFNIFLVFVISGLWHGANFTFVIWAAMHGIIYVIESFVIKKIRLPKVMGWLYLITFHTIALVAFRAVDMETLKLFYANIFSFNYSATTAVSELFAIHKSTLGCIIAVAVIVFLFLKELQEEYVFVKHTRLYSRLKPLFYMLLLLIIFVFGKFGANEFIYFHF